MKSLARAAPAAKMAPARAAPPGLVDQLPGRVARRVLEGRAAGLLADRLGGLAPCGDLGHAGGDGGGIVGTALEYRLDPDDVAWRIAMPIGVAEVLEVEGP